MTLAPAGQTTRGGLDEYADPGSKVYSPMPVAGAPYLPNGGTAASLGAFAPFAAQLRSTSAQLPPLQLPPATPFPSGGGMGAPGAPGVAYKSPSLGQKGFRAYEEAILRGLGAPINRSNLAMMNAWGQFEGTSARNNPFATTFREPGATAFNSVGVRNYTNFNQGVDAGIDTLGLGYYRDVVKALRSGQGLNALSALNASPWGSHPTNPMYWNWFNLLV